MSLTLKNLNGGRWVKIGTVAQWIVQTRQTLFTKVKHSSTENHQRHWVFYRKKHFCFISCNVIRE